MRLRSVCASAGLAHSLISFYEVCYRMYASCSSMSLTGNGERFARLCMDCTIVDQVNTVWFLEWIKFERLMDQ